MQTLNETEQPAAPEQTQGPSTANSKGGPTDSAKPTTKASVKPAASKAPRKEKSAARPSAKGKKSVAAKVAVSKGATDRRKSGRKPYPVVAFADAVALGEAIMKHNGGLPANRNTLLAKMGLEAGSASTRNLITNSNKYGITEGNHSAPTLKLSAKGHTALDPKAKRVDQMKAKFELAIGDVAEFKSIYEKRKGHNMPAPEMLHDDLQEVDPGDRKPCVDVFTSNVRYLGLLVDREGAQYLLTFEEWLGHLPPSSAATLSAAPSLQGSEGTLAVDSTATDFDKVCFVISTIKEAGSEERKHADMILNQYIERALDGTGLKPLRADKIGDPGMISKRIIEYIIHSKLVVADLSFHNPNVFYELCLRHVTGKPTVHLIQESDRIPFDLANFHTIKVNTADKYRMVSELDSLRSEISTAIRKAVTNGESRDNPILTFCPTAKFVLGS